MLATAMSGLMPVEVLPETPRVRAPETTAGTPGVVEVTMPSGVTVHVSGCVDLAVLRGVLAEFGERCVRPIARHAGVPGLRRDRHAEGL